MIGFTKALAQENAKKGVTVNVIAPGYIDTEMVSAVPQNVLEQIIAGIPVGRLGMADEIARCVAFLARGGRGLHHRRDPERQRRAVHRRLTAFKKPPRSTSRDAPMEATRVGLRGLCRLAARRGVAAGDARARRPAPPAWLSGPSPPHGKHDAAVARYRSEDGTGFIVDRSTARPLLRFDDSPEIWALSAARGPRGDMIYLPTSGGRCCARPDWAG